MKAFAILIFLLICQACNTRKLQSTGCVCKNPILFKTSLYPELKLNDQFSTGYLCHLYSGENLNFYQYFEAAAHATVNNYFIENNGMRIHLTNDITAIEETLKALSIDSHDLNKILTKAEGINNCVSNKKGYSF